jgi:hypothetical protein
MRQRLEPHLHPHLQGNIRISHYCEHHIHELAKLTASTSEIGMRIDALGEALRQN